MSYLFSPLTIKNVTLKNRIIVSPMCQFSSKDGFADNWHLVHLGSRAVGGAGLVITEATAVCAEGRISAGDLGIYKDEHIEKLKEITTFIHAHGAASGIQLTHAGRKASHQIPWQGGKLLSPKETDGWQTAGPSAVPFTDGESAPVEMSKYDIEIAKKNFQDATLRAIKAGFQIIELHAAHGYLIHQFLSPISNHRSDEYGGSFDNRIRFLMEVVESVKEVWPGENPLFVRISATDWVEGGWTPDESVVLAEILKEYGVDFIDCSTGGNVATAKIPIAPGYQVPFAEAVRKTGILTGAVGLITEPIQAEKIIENGQADAVILAREFLRDPYFPLRAAHELGQTVEWPVQYDRGKWPS